MLSVFFATIVCCYLMSSAPPALQPSADLKFGTGKLPLIAGGLLAGAVVVIAWREQSHVLLIFGIGILAIAQTCSVGPPSLRLVWTAFSGLTIVTSISFSYAALLNALSNCSDYSVYGLWLRARLPLKVFFVLLGAFSVMRSLRDKDVNSTMRPSRVEGRDRYWLIAVTMLSLVAIGCAKTWPNNCDVWVACIEACKGLFVLAVFLMLRSTIQMRAARPEKGEGNAMGLSFVGIAAIACLAWYGATVALAA